MKRVTDAKLGIGNLGGTTDAAAIRPKIRTLLPHFIFIMFPQIKVEIRKGLKLCVL